MPAPRVLIVAARDVAPVLGGTVLWRTGIERVFSPNPVAAIETAAAVGARLVLLDAEGVDAALRFVEAMRSDPLTRKLSLAILARDLRIEEEDALRVAGANLVLSGHVDPAVWDGRLEELLNVPRRREVRVPVLCEAWSSIGGARLEGWALNLSMRGALLETDQPLDLGTSIDVTLQLPATEPELRAVARVVREAGAADGRHWSGVEFLILRGDAHDRLQDFIGRAPGQ